MSRGEEMVPYRGRKTGRVVRGFEIKEGDRVVLPAVRPCEDFPEGLPEEMVVVFGPIDEDGMIGYSTCPGDQAEAPLDPDGRYEVWEEVR